MLKKLGEKIWNGALKLEINASNTEYLIIVGVGQGVDLGTKVRRVTSNFKYYG